MTNDQKAAGTFCAWMELPWPWPARLSITLIRHDIANHELQLSCEPSGKLRAQLFSQIDESPILTLTSCPLLLIEPAFVLLAVAWQLPDDMIVRINDTTIASLTIADVPEEYHLPKRNHSGLPAEDFSSDGATELLKRRGSIPGHQPIHGRRPGTRETAFKALKSHVVQMNDLLYLLDGGALDHAHGLANLLRSLIATGVPLPLLQLCAAYIDAPLTLFTSARPRTLVPMSPTSVMSFDISAVPTKIYANSIDLDVWLSLPASTANGRDYTHRDVVKSIGNTIGAHVAHDIHPLIEMLRATGSAAMGGTEHDMLVTYVRLLATETLQLSHDILMRS